ncbi:MAG: GNAT family N-acetyltransferase [Pseudomonadota bacterium]
MHKDFLDELGELALGSRLKRLSDLFMGQAQQTYDYFDVDMQPKWFTLLALLDRYQEVNIVQAAELLGLSQPAVSQYAKQLRDSKFIDITPTKEDSRRKLLTLTPLGRCKVGTLQPMWHAVADAAKKMCVEYENSFYQSMKVLEKSISQATLTQRAIDEFNRIDKDADALSFLSFSDEVAPYFEIINKQWIRRMFKLEDIDIYVLENPKEAIIDKGGYIWFAKHPSLGICGTCALLNKGDGAYELTKMGVLSQSRGFKVGEKLLQYVLSQVDLLGLDKVFLLTNANCEAAIHLYEKNGFVHSEEIMDNYGRSYERCNVAMHYVKD